MTGYLIAWTIAFLVFAILEALTTQLVSIWFAIGSLAALISAAFGASLFVQLIVFIIVAIVLLIATRPLAKKFNSTKKIPTNADRLIGKIGYVIEPIDNFKEEGRIEVDNQDWSARSIDGTKLEKGTNVVVKRIEGVKLIVHVALPEDYMNNDAD